VTWRSASRTYSPWPEVSLRSAGWGLVIAEIVKVQRREIPEHRGWVVRSLAAMRAAGNGLADEVARLLRREPERHDATVHVAALSGTATAGGTTTGTLTVASAPTLAERVERLEAETRRLDEQAAADRTEMRAEAREAKSRIDAAAREIRVLIEERDRQRREGVRDALTLQWIGTIAFIVGVGLSVWGNLAPC
jgi:outer membrane murein-binding lipoprotein Lpp